MIVLYVSIDLLCLELQKEDKEAKKKEFEKLMTQLISLTEDDHAKENLKKQLEKKYVQFQDGLEKEPEVINEVYQSYQNFQPVEEKLEML